MMRLLAKWMVVFALTCFGSAVVAQDPEVTVTFGEEPVFVGQAYSVRVKVLVPTFMPKAPVWPSYEAPGLIVRFPGRSTSPTSGKVGGVKWFGVSRRYTIYPTRVGIITIPKQDIVIVYKDPETNEDVRVRQAVPEITISALVPKGAEELDPLIVSDQVTVAQTWEAPDGVLNVGDAIVRKLDVEIIGASPLFIPPLLQDVLQDTGIESAGSEPKPADGEAEVKVAALSSYPQEPKLTETIERTLMSGTRQDQVTYVVQTGGRVDLPELTLSWFNLKTGDVETITLEGRHFEVAEPPAVAPTIDRDAVVRGIGVVVIVLVLLWLWRRFVGPWVQEKRQKIRGGYEATSHYASKQAIAAAKNKDMDGLFRALDVLAERQDGLDPDVVAQVESLTAFAYSGREKHAGAIEDWGSLIRALENAQKSVFAPSKTTMGNSLPTLNPFTDQAKEVVYLRDVKLSDR